MRNKGIIFVSICAALLLSSCAGNTAATTAAPTETAAATKAAATLAETTVPETAEKKEASDAVKVLNERAEKYIMEMAASSKVITTDTNADWYSLSNGVFISEFIPSFKRTDMTLFEIQKGELVYVGPEVTDPENLVLSVATPLSGGLAVADNPEYYEALLAMADEYYYQGNELLYDQYNVRRNVNCLPNDATADRSRYLDCSSFANSIYYNTLLAADGTGMNPSAAPATKTFMTDISTNYAKEDEPAYLCYFHHDDKAESQWTGGVGEDGKIFTDEEMLQALKELLQPGDVLITRLVKGNGHTIIYIGDGMILHSTGGSIESKVSPETVMEYATLYSDNSSENSDAPVTGEMANGTVYRVNYGYFFDRDMLVRDAGNPGINCRYLAYDGAMLNDGTDIPGNRVLEIGVMRPLMMEGYTGLTKEAEAVMANPGVTIEKQLLKDGESMYSKTVLPGDTLTWSVKVENHSNETHESITVTDGEMINEKVTLTPAGTDGAVKILTAEYKVPSDAATGNMVSTRASAGGITSNEVLYRVGKKSENDRREALEKALDTDLTSEKEAYGAAKLFYQAAFGEEILKGFDAEAAGKLHAAQDGNLAFPEELPIIDTMQGGYTLHANLDMNLDGIDYIRRVRPEYLEAGDLIMSGSGSGKKITIKDIYIFIDKETVYHFDETEEGIKLNPLYTDEKTVTSFLTSLYVTKGFMILRPVA